MKIVLLTVLTFLSYITSEAQSRFTGYIFTFQTGAKERFEYTASTGYSDGTYITAYKIFKPGSHKNRYTITAVHFKDSKTVTVMVKDEEYLLSEMDGSQQTTYEEPSEKPFGFRGDLALLARSAPSQLAVQFISNRFEYIRVLSFLGSPSGGDFQYFIFNSTDRIVEAKVTQPKPVARDSGRADSIGSNSILFIGTKKFCDGENAWYYKVTIVGNKITLRLFADKNNPYQKDKVNPKETVIGVIEDGKIITKDAPEYLTNRFKIEHGVLYEVNNEGGYNEYQECKPK